MAATFTGGDTSWLDGIMNPLDPQVGGSNEGAPAAIPTDPLTRMLAKYGYASTGGAQFVVPANMLSGGKNVVSDPAGLQSDPMWQSKMASKGYRIANQQDIQDLLDPHSYLNGQGGSDLSNILTGLAFVGGGAALTGGLGGFGAAAGGDAAGETAALTGSGAGAGGYSALDGLTSGLPAGVQYSADLGSGGAGSFGVTDVGAPLGADTSAFEAGASTVPVGGTTDYGTMLGLNTPAAGSGIWNTLTSGLPAGTIPALANVAAGVFGAGAAKSAAATQAGSAAAALAQNQSIYNQTRADNAPFLASGTAANARRNQLMGLDPSYTGADSGSLTRGFTTADLNADPVYQNGLKFGLDQGVAGINSRAMQTGSYDSGATLKALTRFGNDYGSTKAQQSFDNFNTTNNNTYGRLTGAVNTGQNAASLGANSGANFAGSASNLITGAGNATAAGQVGAANAVSNAASGVSTAYNNAQNSQILQALLKHGNYGSVYG